MLSIGLVGLDTSHVTDLCRLINKKKIVKARIDVGYPGGSDACEVSYSRVGKFTMVAANHGVEIEEDLEKLTASCDAIIMTSCDGRQHLEQFEIIAPHGKPVFIDKPFTCSLADARAILDLSHKHGAPVFSTSSLRYAKGIGELALAPDIDVVEVHGPVKLLPDYPGWFWYGVHSAEILFTILGPGVKSLQVFSKKDGDLDLVVASWNGDRTGICFGHRYDGLGGWGGRTWGNGTMKEFEARKKPGFMEMLVPEIFNFFKTGESPVPERVLLEITAFLETVNGALGIDDEKGRHDDGTRFNVEVDA